MIRKLFLTTALSIMMGMSAQAATIPTYKPWFGAVGGPAYSPGIQPTADQFVYNILVHAEFWLQKITQQAEFMNVNLGTLMTNTGNGRLVATRPGYTGWGLADVMTFLDLRLIEINRNVATIASASAATLKPVIDLIKIDTGNIANRLFTANGTVAQFAEGIYNNTKTANGSVALFSERTSNNTITPNGSVAKHAEDTANNTKAIVYNSADPSNIAYWIKELRDFFLTIPTIPPITWYNDPSIGEPVPPSMLNPFEVLFDQIRGDTTFTYDETAPTPTPDARLNGMINRFVRRYDVETAIHIPSDISPQEKRNKLNIFNIVYLNALNSSLAERAYTSGNQSIDRLQTYLNEAETSPSLKRTIDINTRVLIEIGQTNAKILQMLATMNMTHSAQTTLEFVDNDAK